jgi:hypothetical protein
MATTTEMILDQLRVLIPGVTTVKTVATSRVKRDTLDDARAKVAKKLRDNIVALSGSAAVEKVDPVYKKQADGKYGVGIKYGNRYLIGAIAGGTFVPGVSAEQLPKLLEMLAGQVERGLYDPAIEKVMQDNVAARNKVTH